MYKKSQAFAHIVWMTIFVIAPIVLVLLYSLYVVGTDGQKVFSFQNYIKFFDITYIKILLKSVYLAAVSSVICLILGYPAAYILANRDKNQKSDKKSSMILLFVLPMWMNMLLRTYSWLTILEKNGLLNTILGFLGFPQVNILYTSGAVVLGMVYNFIPFMILPIYSILVKIDESVLDAARDLGSNPMQVFLKVTLPLSIPGIISGVTMVFLPAVTTFIISRLLGGGHYMLVGNLIENQFLVADDWNFGSAVSIIMMALILICMKVMNIFSKGEKNVSMF